MRQEAQIPKWLTGVTFLLGLLAIVVSIVLLLMPEAAVKTVDFSGKGVDYLIQMWAIRQFAAGFIFLFSMFRKSIPMLTIAYVFYLVMNLGDVAIGIVQNDSGLYLGATFMVIVSIAILFFATRRSVK